MCRVAYFCLIYFYIPLFWWNSIHALFFFWYICFEFQRAWILFLQKEFTLSVFSVCSFQESPNSGTSRNNNSVEKSKKHPSYKKSINFSDFLHTMGFVAISCTAENWWENPCIFHMMTLINFFLWALRFEWSVKKPCVAKVLLAIWETFFTWK